MANRVVDQIRQHLIELVRVQPHLREHSRDHHLEALRRVAGRNATSDQPPDCGGHVDYLLVQFEPTGINARNVEQLRNEAGDPIGIGVDGLQHQQTLLVVEAVPFVQQRCGKAFDARERRTQFVCHGRHQIRSIAFGALAFSRAAKAHDELLNRPAFPTAHVARGDVQLALVRQHQATLGLAGANGKPVVGPGTGPPVAAHHVGQRQDLSVVTAQGLVDAAAQEGGPGQIDEHHGARLVGNEHPVGQRVERSLLVLDSWCHGTASLPGDRDPTHRCAAALRSRGSTSAGRRVEADRGRCREVQAFGAPVDGDADRHVSGSDDLVREPPRLVPEDPRRRLRRGGRRGRARRG